jgi:hypothetical protein
MKKQFLITLVVIFTCGIINSQNLIRVNNNPDIDADYTNLQDANDNASNDDTIYVESSVTAYPSANITKSVTIIGPGFFLDENPNTQANTFEAELSSISFETGSDGSIIIGCKINSNVSINVDNITVKKCNAYSIYLYNSINNILILQNYIRSSISTLSGGLITNSVISNNIVKQNIDLSPGSGSVQISNNVIIGTGSSFNLIDCYNSTIQNNIIVYEAGQIYTNTGNSINNNILAIDGTNANGNQYNIDMSLVFEDFNGSLGFSTDGRWQLKAGSPAIGAGIGDVDCGAFGGTIPYVLSGLPDLPHIYEATIPATADSEAGLSVTVKVKSGN